MLKRTSPEEIVWT